jgi:hypothetical protein
MVNIGTRNAIIDAYEEEKSGESDTSFIHRHDEEEDSLAVPAFEPNTYSVSRSNFR